jgi:hypothetical protein
MEPEGSLFDMSGFALDVEGLRQVFTQVATPKGPKARIRDRVLGEAGPLCGEQRRNAGATGPDGRP